jgi:aspartyl-tRNA synthetase
MCFMMLRDQYATVQAGLFVDDNTSKGMVTYASKIPKESIVDIKAKVTKAGQEIVSCTQSKVELTVLEIWTVNKSAPMLPFQIEDASRVVTNQQDEAGEGEGVKDTGETKSAVVKQDVRLNNRIIDLRVPTNHAIMRLQAAVSMLFREYMYDNDFTEIHSPKLIGGASEGGSNVFTLKYFGQPACLA